MASNRYVWLNDNSYRNKYGGVFKSAVVSDMIKNEKYKGVYIYNQFKRQKINGITKDIKQSENEIIRVEGGIPAIVSEELWEAANSMNQKTKKASRNNCKVTYLLSGLIACGVCGMSFAGDRAPARGNRKERIVYRCIGEKKNKTCKNKAIRQDVVEQIVIYELDRILSNEGIDDMIDMLYKDMAKKMMDMPSVIKKAEQELNKIMTLIN